MRAAGADAKGTFCWSPDGRRFAVIGGNSQLTVYDVANYESVAKIKFRVPPPVWSSWNSNGRRLAVATKKQIVILDGRTLEELGRLNASDREITCGSWLPGTERIAAGYADGTMEIWDTKSDNIEEVISGDGVAISAIDANSDGKIAIGSDAGSLRIRAGSGEHDVATLGNDLGDLRSISFDPEGRRLAHLTSDGVIQLWNVTKREKLRSWQAHESGAARLAWSPDGKRLASAGGTANSLRIWDPSVGLELARFNERSPVWWAQWSQDGRRLAIGVSKDKVEIWTASSPRPPDLSSAQSNQKE